MKPTKTSFFLLFLSAFLVLSIPAAAESVASASERMEVRLPQIDALKLEGKVGETSDGYLAPRTSLGPRQASIVEAENADRRIIYTAVAQRTGEAVAEVGKNRALRIAEMAKPGIWLQKANGDWYKKPGKD